MGRRLESYKKNFPELDCIGWYSADFSNSDEPQPIDSQLQKTVQQFSENPLYLIMNPSSQEAMEKKTLPYFLYEYEQQRQRFIRLDYNLATSDSERISVDHVAKAIDPNAKTSVLSQNMLSTINAVKILRRKIAFLIDIVTHSPEVRSNHDFMRKLNQIVNQLPITTRDSFNEHIFSDYSDIAAVNLLTSVTKGFELLNDLLETYKGYQGRDGSSLFQSMEMMDGNFGMGGGRYGSGMDEEAMSALMGSQSRQVYASKMVRKQQ